MKLNVTLKAIPLHSFPVISLIEIAGVVSSSLIVATHVASLIVAFRDGMLSTILNVSLHSFVKSSMVATLTVHVVLHAGIVNIPHVYV